MSVVRLWSQADALLQATRLQKSGSVRSVSPLRKCEWSAIVDGNIPGQIFAGNKFKIWKSLLQECEEQGNLGWWWW
jgi:hypothetical protein